MSDGTLPVAAGLRPRVLASPAGPAGAGPSIQPLPARFPVPAQRPGTRPGSVLHVLPWLAAGGGVQRFVREIAAHQRAEGVDASILTTSAHGDGDDTAYVRRVDAPFFVLRTPFAPAFRHAIEKAPADLIHVHGPNPLVDWSVLGIERPYVYSLYNAFPATAKLASPLVRFGKRLCRWAVERARGVAVLDPGLVREPWLGLRRPVWHVPPGVEVRTFRPLDLHRRREVVFAGHVRPEKGLHVLIAAMRHLPDDVGLRVLASVKYARGYALRQIAEAERTLKGRFRWQADATDEELARAFNEAGCVAVPSVALETWNLVLLEAAACGAPVVRSDLPALAWADFSPSSRAGDPADLARAIGEALARSPELSRRALAASRPYRWERTCGQLGAFYAEALSSSEALSSAPGGHEPASRARTLASS